MKIRTKRYVRTLLIFVVMFLAGSLLSRGHPVPAAESPVPAVMRDCVFMPRGVFLVHCGPSINQVGRLSFFKSAANRGSLCKLFSRGSIFVDIRLGSRWA